MKLFAKCDANCDMKKLWQMSLSAVFAATSLLASTDAAAVPTTSKTPVLVEPEGQHGEEVAADEVKIARKKKGRRVKPKPKPKEARNEMAVGDKLELGRDNSCAILLDDESCSRRHAVLFSH
ncbi:MAG: FHA domain-containing protein [Deltaproteobacteria bacterium]|nr:FHA domain-containing protein [Deltaproteobacteria bacterium]